MNTKDYDKRADSENQKDPLGLADLPQLEPLADDWNEIRAVLEADQAEKNGKSYPRRWVPLSLAAAASIMLAIVVLMQQPGIDQATDLEQAPVEMVQLDGPGEPVESDQTPATVGELVSMSQLLERRLKHLRDNTGSMPAQEAMYVAELEDMVAQVDGEISFDPESVDLWGQRVNLLLDLEFIYQHQFEREYGRMASL